VNPSKDLNTRNQTGLARIFHKLCRERRLAAGFPRVEHPKPVTDRRSSRSPISSAFEISGLALLCLRMTLNAGAADIWPVVDPALGKLVVTQFASAPFPHPARAEGHRYQGEFFSAAEHYADSTVALFVPNNFRVTEKVDFVVHFHGWRNTVAGTLAQFDLLRQFAASGKNAILIVPEGPRLAPDSFGGKLEDTNGFKAFMTEVMEKLQAAGALEKGKVEIGKVIISGHSGGYHVMAAIVARGGLPVREVWLFDALYGNTEDFLAWQLRENGRILNIYTDHGGTKDESETMMARYLSSLRLGLTKERVGFFAAEETNGVLQNLATNKIVFLHTDLTHNEVIFRREEFRQFLKTSCLQDK
jgi:hypothetical protein